MFNWTKITFLESAENLKPRLKKLTGREPSTAMAREVGLCLQQGRLFYQSAEKSALEIRPLLLFYGTMAFAKALIIGINQIPITSLPQSHGISDISSQNCRIFNLTAKILRDGTFSNFNDVLSKLNKIKYIDSNGMTQYFQTPTAVSEVLNNTEITLKEILSRIPGLENLYAMTFGELSMCSNVVIHTEHRNNMSWDLSLSTRKMFSSREELKSIISELRNAFPVLNNFSLSRAIVVYDACYIDFSNTPIPANEFSEENLSLDGRAFETKVSTAFGKDAEEIAHEPFQRLLAQYEGAFSGFNYMISPLKGKYLSKFSLHYAGIFLLSSLVRYRPQIWGFALTRTARPDGASDDHILSLLEDFMRIHSEEIPEMVAEIFDPN